MIKQLCLSLLFASAAAMAPLGGSAFARGVPDGFSALAKQLSPAVVNISTAQTVNVNTEDAPAFPKGSPLERFNDFFGGGAGQNGRVSKSLGSGFVVDKAGYIVTNNHVIEDADLIEVTFPNGDTYEAELLGRDPATDIALLKIEAAQDIPFVNFGDSDKAEVGEWVMAIGNPFGYAGSVAAGIISARNRDISHGSYDDFIQTDVAINKGNSGGPLFNMAGDVIGVNTAILSPTGYSVGISFSVPADLASSVVDQLREYGETRRGYLGVRPQKVSNAIAKSYGLKDTYGALLTSVVKDSPADKAGLQKGDLITKLGGERLESSRLLSRMIAEAKIDEALEVTYIRKRKTKTAKVTIERLKEKVTEEETKRREQAEADVDRVAMGISVEALTDDARKKYRIKDGIEGVRVVKVDKKAEASGKVLTGDIIEEVGFEPVSSPKAFEEAVEAAKEYDAPIMFLVNRGGNYIFHALSPQ